MIIMMLMMLTKSDDDDAVGFQRQVGLSTLRQLRMPQQICRLAAVVVGSMAAFAAQETSLNCLKNVPN